MEWNSLTHGNSLTRSEAGAGSCWWPRPSPVPRGAAPSLPQDRHPRKPKTAEWGGEDRAGSTSRRPSVHGAPTAPCILPHQTSRATFDGSSSYSTYAKLMRQEAVPSACRTGASTPSSFATTTGLLVNGDGLLFSFFSAVDDRTRNLLAPTDALLTSTSFFCPLVLDRVVGHEVHEARPQPSPMLGGLGVREPGQRQACTPV
jgi:hypothetical protein